ncbi:MAG: NADH-quinone oxidoreductase subunit C [Pseudomonadota bacterium]
MSEPVTGIGNPLAARLAARFAEGSVHVAEPRGEVTLDVPHGSWLTTAVALRDEFGFEQLVDLCGVDYLGYGTDEWDTSVSSEGFSRGVEGKGPGRFAWGELPNGAAAAPERRFAVVAHLLSVQHNLRLRVRTFAPNDDVPAVASLVDVWPGVNWFEREAFDLFGIVFDGHPDLRRILTDYGFVGHPFRKDFPLIGNVEVRYDAERRRVVYQPVTIEPRVLVPRVIRDDARYETSQGEQAQRTEARR